MSSLRTEAWVLRGISSVPGSLSLQAGNLAFEAAGAGSAWPWQLRKLEAEFGAAGFATAVENGGRSGLFSFPAAKLKTWVPWHYFGGGIKILQGAHLIRISFGRPGNTRVNWIGSVADNVGEIGVMRKRGELWQEALRKAGGEQR